MGCSGSRIIHNGPAGLTTGTVPTVPQELFDNISHGPVIVVFGEPGVLLTNLGISYDVRNLIHNGAMTHDIENFSERSRLNVSPKRHF